MNKNYKIDIYNMMDATKIHLTRGLSPREHAVMQNDKRATRGDSLFENGVVSIKSCSHAETYRIVKIYVLTLQR